MLLNWENPLIFLLLNALIRLLNLSYFQNQSFKCIDIFEFFRRNILTKTGRSRSLSIFKIKKRQRAKTSNNGSIFKRLLTSKKKFSNLSFVQNIKVAKIWTYPDPNSAKTSRFYLQNRWCLKKYFFSSALKKRRIEESQRKGRKRLLVLLLEKHTKSNLLEPSLAQIQLIFIFLAFTDIAIIFKCVVDQK